MASNIALKGWNIVAGKLPRRGPSFNPYKARTRPQQNQQNPKAKASVKRARVSTASTTPTISTDEIRSPSRSIMTLTLETFKSLNVDEKLDNIFLYLQNIREVSERLDVTESHVRELRDRVDDNSELLKNNKTSSNDNIINEFIQESVELMMPIYISLFNLILNKVFYLNAGLKA